MERLVFGIFAFTEIESTSQAYIIISRPRVVLRLLLLMTMMIQKGTVTVDPEDAQDNLLQRPPSRRTGQVGLATHTPEPRCLLQHANVRRVALHLFYVRTRRAGPDFSFGAGG